MGRQYSVIWSHLARQDLRNLGQRIRQDSPDNARRFLKKLRDAAATLGNFPERLSVVPELGLPYRERPVGRYRIIYRVQEDQVIVLAVEHSARELLGAIGHRLQEADSP